MIVSRERVVRRVRASALDQLERFLESPLHAALTADGRLIGTRRIEDASEYSIAETTEGEFAASFEHPRVEFISYPYEWPAEMLHAAGQLTLEIAREALDSGWGLKDASPFNVAFRGCRPVFLDVLSFEERSGGDAAWLPYAQFVRMFVLPLLAARDLGIPVRASYLGAHQGLEPEELYDRMSAGDKLRAPSFSLVTMPVMLGRVSPPSGKTYQRAIHSDPEKARFILRRLFTHLDRALEKVKPPATKRSQWSAYTEGGVHEPAYHERKRLLVEEILRTMAPKAVLDLGCNTGSLSVVAATLGSRVVAVDSDAISVGVLFSRAVRENLDILPLVVDLLDPTPARGWLNREYQSFIDRAAGAFDAVLAVSLIHHLMLAGGVPLAEILVFLGQLSSGIVVVEFVPRDDPMFVVLARGRDALHENHTRERFVALCQRDFDVIRADRFPGSGREVFALRKKNG